MAILIFLLVLFALVLVHEFGHFWTAKKTGMRVDEFGIGFPPKLFGIKKGETEYTLNALPIGGFVRIFGEDLDAAAETQDVDRSFASKSKWAQALVLVAGVTANVLFAWFLFALALGIGVPTAVDPQTASADADLYIVDVLPGSPAAEADIPAGAMVTSLSTDSVTVHPSSPDEFQTFIAGAVGEEITVTYTFGGEEVETALASTAGVIESAPEQQAVGVSLALVENQALPIHEAIGEGFMMTVTGLRDITIGISTLLANAVTFDADLSQVAGPVGIVGMVGDATALGVTTLLLFTAFISLNLAIINLLPFPALDGGRLLFVAIEAIKGSPIRPKIAYYANATGFVLLILLMVAITFNDIARIT